MRTPLRQIALVALCLSPVSLATAAEPVAAPALSCSQLASPVETAQGLALDFDPLHGAERRSCSAIATCNNFPSVSCTGNTTCSSYDGSCPLQWRGMVICDGVTTYCDVDDQCVAACDAERNACHAGGGGFQCQLDHGACLCGCN